jgi:uncharacterized protein
MPTEMLFQRSVRGKAAAVFLICLLLLVGAMLLASLVQRDFGNVEVKNVTYENYNGILVRAKLLKPLIATAESPAPGIVYVHGYQNNRETSDAYAIELARRGFVILSIDAIGRGNSGIPGDPRAPDFDETYGTRSSLAYLRSLPFVDESSVGVMGHSLGAEMVYTAALNDPGVNAVIVSGFAYTLEATANNPRNLLMIFGQYDEYRLRMTGTQDFGAEWMSSPQTRQVIADDAPQFAVTYGDFTDGSARRVFMPPVTHVQESHHREAIGEALVWMKSALNPPGQSWIDPAKQIWPLKEWATLAAMLFCFAAILPLGLLLLQTGFFAPLQGPAPGRRPAGKSDNLKGGLLNGVLSFLYLPLVLTLFAVHVYLVPIDGVFPLMMVNGTVWWFLWINIFGFLFFRRWYKKEAARSGLTLQQLGLSDRPDGFGLSGAALGKTFLLGLVLFGFAYGVEHLLESLLIVDFRFIFPFASDLTPYRALMFLLYFPFLLAGFLLMGTFLHARLARPVRRTWFRTFVSWSGSNILVMVVPLLLLLLLQYVPIFTVGVIPFVGPGGVLTTFMINLAHIILKLLLLIPIMTWFYQLTGKIYLGSLVAALLVTWMFISSQVIAPIPV